jgi:shikimate kinase
MAGSDCGVIARSPPSAQAQTSAAHSNARLAAAITQLLRTSTATHDLFAKNLLEPQPGLPEPVLALPVSPSIAGAAMEHELSPDKIAALARRIDRPIVLVGMMGAGKSSVGRRLATILHLPFTDADDEIVHAAQMSIPEMFEQYGEDYFRDGERRVIARLVDCGRGVIATGGGAFANPETRAMILAKAIAIWLDSDLEVLLERVSRNSNRPLLRDGNPRETLTRLKATRESAYSEAPIHVKSAQGPHTRVVNSVLKGLDAWL